MAPGLTRTLKGAASGAVAASVWALQQPLDKALFASRYDDVELLGRLVRPEQGWRGPGLLIHLANGAAFGALYAVAAPWIPLPPALRGPAAAMVENFGLWPLSALTDRFHPARDELPVLIGNRRALAQATWRHLLFGAILGELERRLNAVQVEDEAVTEVEISVNGHGSPERVLAALAEPGPS